MKIPPSIQRGSALFLQTLERHHWLGFPLIVLLHAFYFCLALWRGGIYTADSPEYLAQAFNIWEGSFYSGHPELPYDRLYETMRPPLYALFILLVKVFFATDYFVLFVQNLLSLMMLWLLIKFCRKELEMPGASLFLALALLFFPTFLIYVNSIMADLLFTVFLVGAMMAFYRFLRQPSAQQFFMYCGFLVFAVLTKPVLLYFLWLNVGLALWLGWKHRRVLFPLLSFLPLVFVLLISLYNQKQTDYLHFTAAKSVNLYWFNARTVLMYTEGEAVADSLYDAVNEAGRAQETLQGHLELLQAEARTILLDQPLTYALLHGKAVLEFYLLPGRESMLEFLALEPLAVVSLKHELTMNGWQGLLFWLDHVRILLVLAALVVAFWSGLVVLAALWFLFRVHVHPLWKAWLVVLVLYIAAASAFGGTISRFRMAVYLPMVIMALYTLQALAGADEGSRPEAVDR